MAIRHRYHDIDENSSQQVFALRKSGQLQEAYSLAVKLYNQDPEDEWIKKSYAWVLIDIIKIEIKNNSGKANSIFDQLLSMDISNDEIILKQINFLRPKLNPNYQEVQQAENLSKNGIHAQAIDLYRQLQNQGKLASPHHESFGWAIYRYINACKDNLPIVDVKKLLFDYLKLNNNRPSLLHSVVLRFSVNYARQHNQFNLLKFFQLWNPKHLRAEDKEKESDNGKTYPALVERLLHQVSDNNDKVDVNYLQNVIGDKELVTDSIRESYFWKIFNLHKENSTKELWVLFDHYVSNFSIYGESHWHSEILKIADRFMEEDNTWRFYDFFQKWGTGNFQYNDWHEEINGDFKNKPLVIKALKKVFKLAKLPGSEKKDFTWILPLYKEALEVFDDDIWILREYATILNVCDNTQEAIKIYKNILLDLSDQAYVWHEFATLIADSNTEVAISMLCKAIDIQKNEDFLGDIHLQLAKLLVEEGKLSEAKNEVNIYKDHRIKKGWKISEKYESLEDTLKDIDVIGNNLIFYENHCSLAEEYIYSDIPWKDFLIYDKWENKKKNKISAFTDLNDLEFIVKVDKFEILSASDINTVIQFKTHFDKANNKHIALQAQRSTTTYTDIKDKASPALAIVDHVNDNKKLFHYVIDSSLDGIVGFSQTNLRPNIGDFLEIKYFITYNEKHHKKTLHILDISATNEENNSLIKEVSGQLSLKYKDNGRTIDYQDIISNELDIDTEKPDFAFIDDYYVAKYILRKHHISSDCEVTVKVLFNGEKWSVFELIKR
ncbi:hypothetical protein HN385_08200 [archaeon]|jgi:hypothetical protein|nr:hypothetical protein [archaeon]MBT4795722.1 hypothetical protein [Candidatus Neomarinimicrobiota bacterium]